MKFFTLLAALLSASLPLAASAYTNWTEDPADPIYTPYPLTTALYDDYFPCVLYNANKFNGDGDQVFYKMWHQGSGTATGTLALSTSDDGIHWTLKGDTNLVAPPGQDVGHPTVLYDQNGFGGSPYHYKMWFWNGTSLSTPDAIQYTVSLDGFNWVTPTPITQNPLSPLVGVSGSYFYQTYGCHFVQYNPSPTNNPADPYSFAYAMLYDLAGDAQPTDEVIALAYSNDGLFWTRYGTQPVLIPSGDVNDWDGMWIFGASVIKLQDGYHMFYSGSNSMGTETAFAHGLGTASSPDGITWTKDPANPIFIFSNGVPWRNDRTYTPCVLTDPNNFGNPPPNYLKMWFVGGNQPYTLGEAIGYATLPNPIISAPLPPRKPHGKFVRTYHLKHRKNFVLHVKWLPSLSSNVVAYNVYERGKLIHTIPSTIRRFKQRIHSTRCLRKKFTITSVANDGEISQPITVRKIVREEP